MESIMIVDYPITLLTVGDKRKLILLRTK